MVDAEPQVKIYTIDDIRPLLDRGAVIAAVRNALIAQAKGDVLSPMPGSLIFEKPHGDCHIKYGQMVGSRTFAIKVATGFYDNPKRGLPANNGLILVFDAGTGAPVSLFQDEGWLTAWRTAAATALAAHIFSPKLDPVVGVIGTGLQGQLAVEWTRELLPEASFILHGRDNARTANIATQWGIASAASVEELLGRTDIVITVTPSAKPLFDAQLARAGQHFVSVGADGPEKQELPETLFAKADVIALDDYQQCLEFSDFGRAVQAGVVNRDQALLLGDLLANPPENRSSEAITIIDLTGLAAQDIAIADLFSQLLQSKD